MVGTRITAAPPGMDHMEPTDTTATEGTVPPRITEPTGLPQAIADTQPMGLITPAAPPRMHGVVRLRTQRMGLMGRCTPPAPVTAMSPGRRTTTAPLARRAEGPRITAA